ncbi:hypothetical protein RZN05_09565 [Sphingomonas sp. HF-S4]|uniref:Uncharacterized protein n=1 Tax=Sphingomonas agrestis TaxID=3080540 RepID=A0ABU3Y7F4_9SPHN|nr:hypothetical protein [Sphingomonas sp. HF-S4]MDV3457229.1 hypothetical protein [Sphingomonas sp. HF-S4]
MSIEIGARIPGTNVNVDVTLASRSQQKNDMAVESQHEAGDSVRAAGRPSPLEAPGPLEQLLDTPSPLDRLSK